MKHSFSIVILQCGPETNRDCPRPKKWEIPPRGETLLYGKKRGRRHKADSRQIHPGFLLLKKQSFLWRTNPEWPAPADARGLGDDKAPIRRCYKYQLYKDCESLQRQKPLVGPDPVQQKRVVPVCFSLIVNILRWRKPQRKLVHNRKRDGLF